MRNLSINESHQISGGASDFFWYGASFCAGFALISFAPPPTVYSMYWKWSDEKEWHYEGMFLVTH